MVVAAVVVAAMIAAAAAATAPAPDRRHQHLDLRYEVYGFAGLHLLTDRTVLDLSPDHYTITMDLQTRGLAGFISSMHSHSEVEGRLIAGHAFPEEFRGEVRRDGVDYRSRVDYRPDGTVVSVANPPPKLPHDSRSIRTRDTVDQLTAYLMLERRLAHVGNCTLAVPVYDGRLRYDLYFSDAEQQPDAAAAAGHYAAATRICDMRRREIAGFTADSGSGQGASSGRIWYAPLLPGELMAPVRMDFATEFGTVHGRLAELRGPGADLKIEQ